MRRFGALLAAITVSLAWIGDARALSFCAKKDNQTGLVREGTTIKLRATCRANEIALPVSIEDAGQTVLLTGVNLQIVSGSGATLGTPNGRGNVIVGYNEDDVPLGDPHTGSHNVVIGSDHTFSGSGGLVVGYSNTVSGPFASVTGGTGNVASGNSSWVGGGTSGTASGTISAVIGGFGGQASGLDATTLGGFGSKAEGDYSVAAGGEGARATGFGSIVTGGSFCVASGLVSSVSGGNHVTQAATYGWAAGSSGPLQSGHFTSP